MEVLQQEKYTHSLRIQYKKIIIVIINLFVTKNIKRNSLRPANRTNKKFIVSLTAEGK